MAAPHPVDGGPEEPLGRLVCEARLPLWARVVIPLFMAVFVSLPSAWILARRWPEMGWIALGAFAIGAGLGPFAVLDAANRWVRFYEHGLASQDLFGRSRSVRYRDVSFAWQDRQMRIHLKKGRAVVIPKWEGDFDRIQEIVSTRRPDSDH